MSMFAKDKKTGEIAVKKAYALLKRNGYNPTLPSEIQKDHDIVLGDGRKVEVKFDVVMDSTGNLGVEWWSDRETKVEGWGQYCQADILIQFYNMDNAIVVDWRKFKTWMLGMNYEHKDSKYSKATVITVPMDEIPETVKISDIGQLFAIDYELEHWEIDAIRGRKHSIELAKSGASECIACGERIGKDELRISEGSRWLHLRCAASKYSITELSLDRLVGFDELNEWQTEHAMDIVKRAHEK
jgi:hypothetical protein